MRRGDPSFFVSRETKKIKHKKILIYSFILYIVVI